MATDFSSLGARFVCVCVCNPVIQGSQSFTCLHAGGQCMPDSHCPTKTLSVHGDIWPDQPDVPATILRNPTCQSDWSGT